MSAAGKLNYYQILGVEKDASPAQIRRAFRSKAKQVHPDIIDDRRAQQESETRMHVLISAYRTLSNPALRHRYDRTHNITANVRPTFNFNFREFMRRRTGDYKSLARLLLYELLHDASQEAIDIYEKHFADELDTHINRTSMRKRIAFYFSYRDYMDCLFLLADAYEKQRKYLIAMRLYRNIARLESHKAIFGHFFDDVRDSIKRIIGIWEKHSYTQHIIRFVPSLLDIHSLERDYPFFENKIARSQEHRRKPTNTEYDAPSQKSSRMYAGHMHEG